jgi:hypothetical protein
MTTMVDTEKLAKSVVLTTLGAATKPLTPAEKREQQKINRLTSTPAVKQEIDQMTKRLSRLPAAMQDQLAKKFAVVGESTTDTVVEGFDSVEERDQWIKKNKRRIQRVWLVDTLHESESSKENARLIIEHGLESGLSLTESVKIVLADQTILTKHLKSALHEMHREGVIDLRSLQMKIK